MQLYLVRHGQPDYTTDTLLESGKAQAEAVSERLFKASPELIFASPLGRAVQTASYTAKKLSKEIILEDWAREIDAHTEYPDGVSKTYSRIPAALLYNEQYEKLGVNESIALDFFTDEYRAEYERVAKGSDEFLARLGFRRNEKAHYDFTGHICDKAVLFCHCAMIRVVVARLFSIPPHRIISTVFPNFTSVTTIEFREEADTMPRLFTFGDVGHFYEANLPVPNFMFPGEYL